MKRHRPLIVLASVLGVCTLLGFYSYTSFILRFGLVPTTVFEKWGIPFFSCIFFHSDATHLLGNLLFQCLLGKVILDHFNQKTFWLVFFIGAIMAPISHKIFNWDSHQVATGSSGGTAAFLGFLLIGYSRQPFFARFGSFQVYHLAILAIGTQIFSMSMTSLGYLQPSIYGHAAGLLVGLLLAKFYWSGKKCRVSFLS